MEPTFSYLYSVPYIIFFLIYFGLFLWENKLRNKEEDIKIIRYLGMLVFFVFFGFRGYIDTDFTVYYPLYEMAPEISNTRGIERFFSSLNEDYLLKIEPGFKVVLILLKSITSEYFFLQLVSSFIDVLFLNYFFRKYSPQYILGFIMYFLFSGFIIEVNLIRNSKAIFLFLYSLQFIKDRNPAKYFLFNSIGLLFHSSAIFFFPLYFFLHKKMPQVVVWGTFILGNLLYLAQIKFITPIIVAIGNLLGGTYSLLAEVYSESDLYSTGYGITIGYLEKVLAFILFYKLYEKIKEFIDDEEMLNIWFNLLFIFTMIYLYFSEYSVLIDRMTTLFAACYWILFPYVYAVLNHTFRMAFTLILLLFGTLKTVKSNSIIIRKYSNFIWDKPTVTRAYYIINKHLEKILNPEK